MTWPPMRGQVYRVEINKHGPKPYVIVSNNSRNRRLDSVLAVRVTTTDRSQLPTAVPLGTKILWSVSPWPTTSWSCSRMKSRKRQRRVRCLQEP